MLLSAWTCLKALLQTFRQAAGKTVAMPLSSWFSTSQHCPRMHLGVYIKRNSSRRAGASFRQSAQRQYRGAWHIVGIVQMTLAPHSHDVAPPQLARLLSWLTTGRGGGSAAAGSSELPAWLPELVAACEPLEGAAEGAAQPRSKPERYC